MFEDDIEYYSRIKVTQLLFEKKYIEGAEGKLPLNNFLFDEHNNAYVPINMKDSREVTMGLVEYSKFLRAGHIENLEDGKLE